MCQPKQGSQPWLEAVKGIPKENLSTQVIPVAICSPATCTAASNERWFDPLDPLEPEQDPYQRVAPATSASTPPSTPPVPAACLWPRYPGPPSHTSQLGAWPCVVGDTRPLEGPSTQRGGARCHLPLQLPARARATDRSCTPQAPAPQLDWQGAAGTRQGSPGKGHSWSGSFGNAHHRPLPSTPAGIRATDALAPTSVCRHLRGVPRQRGDIPSFFSGQLALCSVVYFFSLSLC